MIAIVAMGIVVVRVVMDIVKENSMNDLQLEYEQDFHRWIERHIELLRTGNIAELDREHLIEELEGMANRDKNALVSHLKILLMHLLKWQFQLSEFKERWSEFTGKSWRNTILEQRSEIHDQLESIPSLKNQLADLVVKAYPKAVNLAVMETGLPRKTFPLDCPYSVKQLLDDDFYPETK